MATLESPFFHVHEESEFNFFSKDLTQYTSWHYFPFVFYSQKHFIYSQKILYVWDVIIK